MLFKSLTKWDIQYITIQYITDLNFIFDNCYSLIIFHDISKWNTSRVIDNKISFLYLFNY